ncbi:MAG: adenylate kinase [Petrimonas sp.]|nr:adenylate kinase [Petrimonas sp.]
MLNIIIFGAPGSGKGTQSLKLIEKYGLKHISTGDLLRSEIKAGTDLGRLAESYMSQGKLVPDDIVIGMIENLIKEHPDATGFIFDGFPRTLAQGKALYEVLEQNGQDLSVVLSLEVEDKELVERLLKRGEISGRSDDNRETIEARLQVYYDQTAPLKDYYQGKRKLEKIKGQGSIEDIFASIERVVDGLIE